MTSSSAKHTRNKQLIGSCLIKTCLEFMINWLTNTHPNRDLHSWKFTTTNRERCFYFSSCIQEAYEFPIKTWGKKSPSPKEQASYDQSHDQNPSVSYDQSHDQNHSNIMWTEQNNNKQKNRHSHNAPAVLTISEMHLSIWERNVVISWWVLWWARSCSWTCCRSPLYSCDSKLRWKHENKKSVHMQRAHSTGT